LIKKAFEAAGKVQHGVSWSTPERRSRPSIRDWRRRSKAPGATHVTGVGSYSQAPYVQLQMLKVGSYSMSDSLVLVQDVMQMRQIAPRIRGILGDNFLEHCDVLVDYQHRILCLDDTEQMQQTMKGERVALTPVPHADAYLPFTLPLAISTRVSGLADRRLLLQLDSGIDVPSVRLWGAVPSRSVFQLAYESQKR
jgi:hypothetical protein